MTISGLYRGRAIVVFSGRFPNEKADSLFAHENARAFAELGIETVLLAPRRFGRGQTSMLPYRAVYLPTIDLAKIPVLWSIASYLNLFIFSVTLYLYLLKNARQEDFVLCNEPLPLLFASFAGRRTLYEIHVAPSRIGWFYRFLLRRVTLALPISMWNARWVERFGFAKERIVLARSAVDTEMFGILDKDDARVQLGLSSDERIALYTGHLYGWKGVNTLAEAARAAPDIRVMFVGGTARDVERFRNTYADVRNISVRGLVPHAEVPLWQSAADVLVAPNSAKEEISVHFTSPMKLFEYMASRRPIVASDLPSIREILSEETGYFAEADNPQSFADALKHIMANLKEAERRAAAARALAEDNTWRRRAERIVKAVRTI